jgi:hypothetical protein
MNWPVGTAGSISDPGTGGFPRLIDLVVFLPWPFRFGTKQEAKKKKKRAGYFEAESKKSS